MKVSAQAPRRSAALIRSAAALAFALSAVACGGSQIAVVERPEAATKWLSRAEADYKAGRVDEASDAIQKALAAAPDDPELRIVAGRIALSRLEFDESVRLLEGVSGSEARGLRARAHWYLGNLSAAADELDRLLEDPEVRDDWAKSVAELARRGQGRTPFALSGEQVAVVEMASVNPAPFLVLPIELDGEQVLAMVSTSMSEVVIDSSSRAEPSWVSVRFGGRLNVTDVPAFSQDLSGLSKQLNAPIRALIGSSLLRRVNATIDYRGHQFVARAYAAPPPPHATRVSLFYARGGGMMMSSALGKGEASPSSFLVDSSMRFPLSLDEGGWVKAGVPMNELSLVEEDPEQKLREGVVPVFRLGAFDVRRVPGVFGGAPIADIEKGLRFDIDGIVGTPLLAHYRITLAEGGRTLWFEDDTSLKALIDQLDEIPNAPAARPADSREPGAK